MVIPVSLKDGRYEIHIRHGALHRAGEYLNLDRRVLVVTDDGVPAAYAAAVSVEPPPHMLDLGERGFYNAAVIHSFREAAHYKGCEAPEPRLGVVNVRHGKADAFKCGVTAPKARIKPDDLLRLCNALDYRIFFYKLAKLHIKLLSKRVLFIYDTSLALSRT